MPAGQRVRIFETREALDRAAATLFVDAARDAVAARGRFTVALTGGSTPRSFYQRLAEDDALRAAVPWKHTHVFWGDERPVPPSHADSNFRMAHEALVGRVPVPPEQVHRIEAEDPDADRAARAYEATLRAVFDVADGEWPAFDLILLGMGEDGHTLSLFPGGPAASERERLVAAPFVGSLGTHRITLTPPVLWRARAIVLLVAGAAKAPALREAIEGEFAPERCPAQWVRKATGRVTWLVDQAAAALLTERPGGQPSP